MSASRPGRPVRIGALLAVGAASLIWQVASARSLMAGLYGNEFVLALVLSVWLLLLGLGTALGTRVLGPSEAGGRLPRGSEAHRSSVMRLLPVVLGGCPIALVLSLGLQHTILPAYTSLGQAVGPGEALALSALCLAPPCLLLGVAFALVSQLALPDEDAAGWASHVYLWEGLGTVLAGVCFHGGLATLELPLLALAAGVPPVAAALALWVERRARPDPIATAGALMSLGGMALLVPGLVPLAGALVQPRYPGYVLALQKSSRHGLLAVLDRGDQRVFCQNGLPAFSNQDQAAVAAEVHLSLLPHPRPDRVLMISGGLGGGLGQVLRHPVRQVDYVELDPMLVELVLRHGDDAQTRPLRDPRVRRITGDGRALLAARSARYDVILVGLPGPQTALMNRLYTREFFRLAGAALAPGGLLRVTLPGSESTLSDDQALLHRTIIQAMQDSLGTVEALPGSMTLLLARRGQAMNLDPRGLLARLRERRIRDAHFGPTELMSRVLPFRREHYVERLKGIVPADNSDLRPEAHVLSSVQGLAASSPVLAHVLGQLVRRAPGHELQAVLLGLGISLGIGLALRRRPRAAARLGIGLAGFTGLAVELGVILHAQVQRGVIYHELGALLTAFMLGLALGAKPGAVLARRLGPAGLGPALFACALAALGAAALMSMPLTLGPPPLAAVLGVLGALGLAVGLTYAPATLALAPGLGLGPAAARAYAWDLGGASVGALGSALLLPLLGLPWTCLFCGALCLGFAIPGGTRAG